MFEKLFYLILYVKGSSDFEGCFDNTKNNKYKRRCLLVYSTNFCLKECKTIVYYKQLMTHKTFFRFNNT